MKHSKLNTNQFLKYAMIIIIIAILFRFILTFAAHPAGDSCWHLTAARFISDNHRLPFDENLGRMDVFWPPPLFHITSALLHFSFKQITYGLGELAARFVPAFFGALAIIVLYFLVKRQFGAKTAFYSIIFVSWLPLHIYFSTISYIDMMLAFFVILSVYLMLTGKKLWAGVAAGLAIMTKFTGIFVLPVLVYAEYLEHRNGFFRNRKFLFNSLLIIFIALLVSSPVYVRNYQNFGNPVWPFMQNVFGGPEETGLSFSFSNLAEQRHVLEIYLETFGVPNGQIANLTGGNPLGAGGFMLLAIILWLFATLIFSIPVFIGLAKLDYRRDDIRIFAALFFLFLFSLLLYIVNTNQAYSRLLFLPAMPIVCIAWAKGFEHLESKLESKLNSKINSKMNSKISSKLKLKVNKINKIVNAKPWLYVLLGIIVVGFAVAEVIKTDIAAKQWKQLGQDFKWVRQYSQYSQNASSQGQIVYSPRIVYSQGQCFTYNTGIPSLTYDNSTTFINNTLIFITKHDSDSLSIRELHAADLNFTFKSGLQEYTFERVYYNAESGTRVYLIGQSK